MTFLRTFRKIGISKSVCSIILLLVILFPSCSKDENINEIEVCEGLQGIVFTYDEHPYEYFDIFENGDERWKPVEGIGIHRKKGLSFESDFFLKSAINGEYRFPAENCDSTYLYDIHLNNRFSSMTNRLLEDDFIILHNRLPITVEFIPKDTSIRFDYMDIELERHFDSNELTKTMHSDIEESLDENKTTFSCMIKMNFILNYKYRDSDNWSSLEFFSGSNPNGKTIKVYLD